VSMDRDYGTSPVSVRIVNRTNLGRVTSDVHQKNKSASKVPGYRSSSSHGGKGGMTTRRQKEKTQAIKRVLQGHRRLLEGTQIGGGVDLLGRTALKSSKRCVPTVGSRGKHFSDSKCNTHERHTRVKDQDKEEGAAKAYVLLVVAG